jgi:hypothetical protein
MPYLSNSTFGILIKKFSQADNAKIFHVYLQGFYHKEIQASMFQVLRCSIQKLHLWSSGFHCQIFLPAIYHQPFLKNPLMPHKLHRTSSRPQNFHHGFLYSPHGFLYLKYQVSNRRTINNRPQTISVDENKDIAMPLRQKLHAAADRLKLLSSLCMYPHGG